MNVRSAEFVVGAVRPQDLPTDGLPEVAFSGRSNVGKSSLINALVRRRKLARTSSTPGKTQQLNYYRIDASFYMVDLPGYGFVRGGVDLRGKLGTLTETYLEKRKSLCAVVQLIDARHGPTDLDRLMIDWLRQRQQSYLLVFTKADKLSRGKLTRMLRDLEQTGALAGAEYTPFSAMSSQGRDDVLAWILAKVRHGAPDPRSSFRTQPREMP